MISLGSRVITPAVPFIPSPRAWPAGIWYSNLVEVKQVWSMSGWEIPGNLGNFPGVPS